MMTNALRYRRDAGLIFLLVAACATTDGQTRAGLIRQHEEIAALERALRGAEDRGAALLASIGFSNANNRLEDAIDRAAKGDAAGAKASAERGLEVMRGVDATLSTVKDALGTVLSTRERALAAGAAALDEAGFDDADAALMKATRKIEKGDTAAAREAQPALIEVYAALELGALKASASDAADAAIAAAVRAGAEDYAPDTLRGAREEAVLVASVLEADRSNVHVATQHAARARWLAERAEALTALAKRFEEREASVEDILLWHQGQLDAIYAPLKESLPHNEHETAVVDTMRSSYASLLEALSDARDAAAKREQVISELKTELVTQKMEADAQLRDVLDRSHAELEQIKNAKGAELRRLQQAKSEAMDELRAQYEKQLSARAQAEAERARLDRDRQDRLTRVQALFSPDEAQVALQKDDVVIQAYGFSFRPGKAEIMAHNFPLLNKITTAIRLFPGAQVRVVGHTDITGTAAANERLSGERATNVVKFLTDVGGISAERLRSEGAGASRPWAVNTTEEGRAKNRRIEVRITTLEPLSLR